MIIPLSKAHDVELVIDLIFKAHEHNYIKLRNDLIEDIKHEMNDEQLYKVLSLIHGEL